MIFIETHNDKGVLINCHSLTIDVIYSIYDDTREINVELIFVNLLIFFDFASGT